jgi:hypothetical protein
MNCFYHPDRPATAFCQSCGKPLCPACIRSADGLLLCEPDFLSRPAPQPGTAAQPAMPAQPGMPGAGAAPFSASGYRPVGWSPQPGQYSAAPAPPAHASPVLAGLLGFIPGVGAMYNGQFIKALLHVVVFIVLIGATEHFDLAGLLLSAWVFYQVFDAAQTASARRDGRPLPDPFGMLDLSQRLGPQSGAAAPYIPASYAYPPNQPTPSMPQSPASGFASVPPAQQNPAPAGYAPAYAAQNASPSGVWTPGPPTPLPVVDVRRGEPVGAIVLIVIGLLFLLSTLGYLDIGWISRGWPVLVLLLGVWLLFRRLRAPLPIAPYPPPPVMGPAGNASSVVPSTGMSRVNPLSIRSQSPAPQMHDTDEEEK